MVNINFNRNDFCQYRDICVALKQMKSELLDIKSRCTVVDTVQDYSAGFPRAIKIETVLQDKYRRQAAATEAAILELEQRKDVIYRTITLACGAIDMRMYNNVFRYVIKGWSMERIAMAEGSYCSLATVARDIKKFFAEGGNFFEMAMGTDVAS